MKEPIPSREIVEAARTVFMAMALTETVRPVVQGYMKEILIRHQFPMAKKWSDRVSGGAEIIIDPDHAYLLEDEDFAVFIAETKKARDAAGLLVDHDDHCPLLVAEELERQAKRVLIDLVEPITRLSADQVLCSKDGLGNYKKLVELTLQWLAPYVEKQTLS